MELNPSSRLRLAVGARCVQPMNVICTTCNVKESRLLVHDCSCHQCKSGALKWQPNLRMRGIFCFSFQLNSHIEEAKRSDGTYRAEPANIEEHGESSYHTPVSGATTSATHDTITSQTSFAAEKESVSEFLRQPNATQDLLAPLRPSPSPPPSRCESYGGSVVGGGDAGSRPDDSRESGGIIAAAVCITPSPDDYMLQLRQEESRAMPRQQHFGNVPQQEVSRHTNTPSPHSPVQ